MYATEPAIGGTPSSPSLQSLAYALAFGDSRPQVFLIAPWATGCGGCTGNAGKAGQMRLFGHAKRNTPRNP